MTKAALGMTKGALGMTKAALGMTEAGLGMTEAGLGMTKAALGMTKAGLGMMNWVLLECLNPRESALIHTGPWVCVQFFKQVGSSIRLWLMTSAGVRA